MISPLLSVVTLYLKKSSRNIFSSCTCTSISRSFLMLRRRHSYRMWPLLPARNSQFSQTSIPPTTWCYIINSYYMPFEKVGVNATIWDEKMFITCTVFENHRKVSFNIASEASYVYILRGQKLIKNAKNGPFWRDFENLKLAVK